MYIKYQNKGYGQGFFRGQMEERKYWKYKIISQIEQLEKEQEENQKQLNKAIDLLRKDEIDKIGNKIIINMSIRDILKKLL